MLILYLFLFSIAILPVFSTLDPPRNSQEFLLAQLLEPYQHHLSSFLTYNSELFDAFQSLLQLNLPSDPENSLENPLPTHIPNSNPQQEDPQDPKRQLMEAKDWLKCYNGGKAVDIKRNITVCGNTVLTTFGITSKSQNCKTREIDDAVCICPYDAYGAQCQMVNTLSCELKSITFPPEECILENQREKKVSKYYAYNINGDKPCHSVKRNATIDVRYSLECKYERPDVLYEGVKREDGQIYPETALGEYSFVYGLDRGDIKVTHYRTMRMKMAFVDWKIRSKSPSFEMNLKPEHITGEEDIVLNVHFDPKKMKNVMIGGRYNYEVHVHGYGIDFESTRGVIEDADFAEPKAILKPKNRHRVTWISGILVLVVVLIFVCRQKLARYQKGVVHKLDKRRGYVYLEDDDGSVSPMTDDVKNNNTHLKTH